MYRASHVMYTIANIFTWILVACAVAGIVLSSLSLAGVLPADWGTGVEGTSLAYGVGMIVYCSIIIIVGLITIAMVRRAKARGTSKGWDVLFLILGILGGNIFYLLGGIFGLCAKD